MPFLDASHTSTPRTITSAPLLPPKRTSRTFLPACFGPCASCWKVQSFVIVPSGFLITGCFVLTRTLYCFPLWNGHPVKTFGYRCFPVSQSSISVGDTPVHVMSWPRFVPHALLKLRAPSSP